MSTAPYSSLRAFCGRSPKLGQRVWIDPMSAVIGDVEIGDDSSIWPGVVIRADVNYIRIGARTSIQDGAIVHVTHDGPFTREGGWPTVIGDDVTVGHSVVLHGCTLEDRCLVGMHASVMDGAIVRTHGFVGAGALIAPGKIVGEGELWLGNPGRLVRRLSDREIESLMYSAGHYVRLKDKYLNPPA
jgi:carbonic anhydrase/acetyltransferase-like protein (isoleucine patch superfamily)